MHVCKYIHIIIHVNMHLCVCANTYVCECVCMHTQFVSTSKLKKPLEINQKRSEGKWLVCNYVAK